MQRQEPRAVGSWLQWLVHPSRKVKIVLLCIALAYVLLKRRQKQRQSAAWIRVAKRKLASREADRAQAMKVLLAEDVPLDVQEKILALTASELLQEMRERRVTSVQAVVTYCLAAERSQEKLSCLAEVTYEEALKAARDSDKRREEGEDIGPLEGLPISVKDQYKQKGVDASCGMICRLFKPAAEDGLLVDSLRQAGAIPFVRTNVPQLLLLPESVNAIYGKTKNPWNLARSAGGSSGGEGSLIANAGSPLGLGTDIGGSIRIPSHYCGLAGFKPTAGRTSSSGLASTRIQGVSGQTFIKSTAGPMGRSVDDLIMVLKCWWSDYVFDRDPLVPRMPFNESAFCGTEGEKLCIGYCSFDGWFDAAPACKRAVEEAKDSLEALGHELVPFALPRSEEMLVMKLYCQVLSADGRLKQMRRALEGEELLGLYDKMLMQSTMTGLFGWLLGPILRFVGEKRMGEAAEHAGGISTDKYWDVCAEAIIWKQQVLKAWKESGIDVLLFPGGSLPALPHDLSADLSFSCSYTFLFNLLNFPAGVVPTTTTREDEQHYSSRFQDSFTVKTLPVVKGSVGLPVGVQVVALPHADELALRVMKQLEEKVAFEPLWKKLGINNS